MNRGELGSWLALRRRERVALALVFLIFLIGVVARMLHLHASGDAGAGVASPPHLPPGRPSDLGTRE